ncbi:MAG TPA: hypothetical protein VHW64_16015 [Nocardioides sp.]|jgi:hypothetical protein|uniref:hypothetical protein n=1 Tax=Nocardioides sp. TaxID=35761 RepID=UPI002E37366D|nr:hypothetical protein [Nocardioides sp.]HEX3932207.1 hypothetical protein [Nocardioides sp.]
MTRLTHRVASLVVAGLLGAAVLTGCGSSSSTTGSHSPSGFRSGLGSGGPAGGFAQNPALLKKITACLKAAGLSSSLPTGRPSGFASEGPPSGYASGSPVPRPSGGNGGAFFGNSQVQSALKACGITIPRPTGAPSGAATPD